MCKGGYSKEEIQRRHSKMLDFNFFLSVPLANKQTAAKLWPSSTRWDGNGLVYVLEGCGGCYHGVRVILGCFELQGLHW
jgi:hypothetical protein